MNTETTTATDPLAPCPLCRVPHAGPCADAATDATHLLAAGIERAGSARALARIIGITHESLSRAKRRAAESLPEKPAPVLRLPAQVRRALVQYLHGRTPSTVPLAKGKIPKPVHEMSVSNGRVRLGVELPPEILATVISIAENDPARPTRSALLRALLVEGLTARGYDLIKGKATQHPKSVGWDLVVRKQGNPSEGVRVPVGVAEAIDHAANHVPTPPNKPRVSPRAMARVLVGEAILARGIDPWTGKRVKGGTK